MKTSLIKKELSKAIMYAGKSCIACGVIASELQPYFDYKITVFEQSGDGFVVAWEANDGHAPQNIPVLHVLEDLKKDPDAYR